MTEEGQELGDNCIQPLGYLHLGAGEQLNWPIKASLTNEEFSNMEYARIEPELGLYLFVHFHVEAIGHLVILKRRNI